MCLGLVVWSAFGNSLGLIGTQAGDFSKAEPSLSKSAAQPVVSCVTQSMPTMAVSPISVRPAPASEAVAKPVVVDNSGLLDERRQFALGMIETANDDREIGRAGEVSRFQIMPSVWKRYSSSQRYHDPDVSVEVAREHWAALREFFRKQAHREPTDFDMYVLWNTRYGYYANRGYKPERLHPVVRDRAQRFVNLVERGDS